MPTYEYEAMDATTGEEVRDVIEANSVDDAQAAIRQMGLLVTKVREKKTRQAAAEKKSGDAKGKTFAMGGVSRKQVTLFTRQLSILLDAGLPILRSLKVLQEQSKPGTFKNSLIDVCNEIESGSTLSEAMSMCPRAFDRLYVNMIKAGEAGGALETILRRLSEFMERSESLKRKVKGALTYPVAVVTFAVLILVFIMMKIVPQFQKIFASFDTELPAITLVLVTASDLVQGYWWLLPVAPVAVWLFVKTARKFPIGRMGWDLFMLKMPIFGQIIEKNIVARTMRTLGTLIASGVPILEALHVTRETSGNAMFEDMFDKVNESIRQGEAIAVPLKDNRCPPFHLGALFFWTAFIPGIGALIYATRMHKQVLDDMVINMVDVGEETGELDTMLYKVADTYDEEVSVLTESLTSLMEPLLIISLGGMVGFIVIALFMPLVALIQKLT